jgi:RHS repeat-associated protein
VISRSYDTLDRLTAVEATSGVTTTQSIGADWLWGGADRLYGVTTKSDLHTAVRYSYYGQPNSELPVGAPDPGATWKLASMTYGSGEGKLTSSSLAPERTWGSFGFGWRGTEGDHLDGAKVGRVVANDTAGLLTGTGWSWGLDTALRLQTAFAGMGSYEHADELGSSETFRYGYGEGDQLESIVRESRGQRSGFEHGANGRITSRDGYPFGYDAVGRRTEDDRYTYRWDWRSRLYEVTVKEEWPDGEGGTITPTYAGHTISYDYDAAGRLLSRVHSDADGAIFEKRVFIWEGNTLLSEAAYKDTSETELRWRKTYMPGTSGLDDQVQVVVETFPSDPAEEPQNRVYSYIRDELGTVLAVLEEIPGADPDIQPEPIVRYLYDPYGVPAAYTDPTEVPDPGTAEYDGILAAGNTIGGQFPGGQNLLFQGLWTDPVTGISYARARWLDTSNSSWLSEDPKGDVDSSNLYSFVGWRPYSGIDPMGMRDPTKADREMIATMDARIESLRWQWQNTGEATIPVATWGKVGEEMTQFGMQPVYGTIWQKHEITTQEQYEKVRNQVARDKTSLLWAIQRADDYDPGEFTLIDGRDTAIRPARGIIKYNALYGFSTNNEADRKEAEAAKRMLATIMFITNDLPGVFIPRAGVKMSRMPSRAASNLGQSSQKGVADFLNKMRDEHVANYRRPGTSRNQQQKSGGVVAAMDLNTGNTAVGDKLNRKIHNGICAENLADDALGNPQQILFTEMIRPWWKPGADTIPVCRRCEANYGRESFVPEARFQSDLTND